MNFSNWVFVYHPSSKAKWSYCCFCVPSSVLLAKYLLIHWLNLDFNVSTNSHYCWVLATLWWYDAHHHTGVMIRYIVILKPRRYIYIYLYIAIFFSENSNKKELSMFYIFFKCFLFHRLMFTHNPNVSAKAKLSGSSGAEEPCCCQLAAGG